MTTKNNEFGKWRSILFPIHFHELKKLVPLALIFLFISFNYALLRGMKDGFVFNTMTKNSIYALKVLVIPSVVLFTALYTFIAKHVNRDVRFNIVILYFLAFFSLFYLFLLPNYKSLQFLSFSSYLSAKFPNYYHWWDCIRVWPISLFYIHSEVWGTFVLGVSFWTFSNEIVSSEESKRVYPFLMIGAGVGAVLSGTFLLAFADFKNLQIAIILALILVILAIYNVLAKNIAKNPNAYFIEKKEKKNKVRLSFLQSIKLIITSKYLWLMTCMVFGYNMFIIFLESIWKGCVGSYSVLMQNEFLAGHTGMTQEASKFAQACVDKIYGLHSICTGYFSLLWIFFVSSSISKKSWKLTALFTPLVSLVASLIFFIFITFKDYFGSFFSQPLYFIVLFGVVILSFIKSSKYVFFDTSKERAYMPLDEDSKVNGKAAIDAIGSRLAKGLSSVLISGVLIPFYGGLDEIVNVSFCFVFFLIFLWITAVLSLSAEYEKKMKEQKTTPQNTPTVAP